MKCKLRAVVEGNAFDTGADLMQSVANGVRSIACIGFGKMTQPGQTARAFNQSDERPLAALADNGIAFPMTELPAIIDVIGAMLDAHPKPYQMALSAPLVVASTTHIGAPQIFP